MKAHFSPVLSSLAVQSRRSAATRPEVQDETSPLDRVTLSVGADDSWKWGDPLSARDVQAVPATSPAGWQWGDPLPSW